MDFRPIFIGGIHRSGTTLLRELLNSHPEICFWPNDLPFFVLYFEEYKNVDLNDLRNLHHLIEEIYNHEFNNIISPGINIEQVLSELQHLDSVNIMAVIEAFLLAHAKQQGYSRWGLKNPMLHNYADELFKTYPNAVMVHLVRDPRDCFASTMKKWPHYKLETLLDRWSKSVELAMSNSLKYQGSYFVIKYESLIHNPEPYVRRILDVCELSWHPAMMQMPFWLGTNSSYTPQTANPSKQIYKSSIGRYINHLSVFEVYVIQKFLQRDMESLKYEQLPLSIPGLQNKDLPINNSYRPDNPENEILISDGMIVR